MLRHGAGPLRRGLDGDRADARRLRTRSGAQPLSHYFYEDGTSGYAMENIRFADGTVWT
ncbi:calcium-binding protein, partial [Variovorax sp. JS1663]|uniref:calcium-binding protein n=1 Tax=Variovorax sp. JS1663 TaxID=1851577 RepID=UPI003FCF00AB